VKEKITIRVTPNSKRLIKAAASMLNLSLSQFISDAALIKAYEATSRKKQRQKLDYARPQGKGSNSTYNDTGDCTMS
jgi:uncharacterized protein (DUF1778 family)